MAFASGKQSTEASTSFKKYTGVASVKVLAVNPTKEQWNKLLNANREEEIEYTSVKDDVKNVRITFLCKCDKIDEIIPLTFFLKKAQIQGSQSGKIKIIDKYGRTAWATQADIDAKQIPQYTNGPAKIDADYRKCVSGEEELTMFLKALMCIPDIQFYNRTTSTWEDNPNPNDCQARLDKVMKYFDGDVSEVRSILKAFPENQVKVLLGVRTVEDREYQDFFKDAFVLNGNPSNLLFVKRLDEARAVGRFANTNFGEVKISGKTALHEVAEYKITSTEYRDNNQQAPTVQTDGPSSDSDLPF